MKIDFPNVITIEHLSEKSRDSLSNNQQLINKINQQASRGVVSKEGTWIQSPGPWKIEKLGIGSYKIIHNWGYFNTSLSVTLILSVGTIKTVENSPTYFMVETYSDNKLTDMPFAFTLIKVISP